MAGFERILIICPPHLVPKWKREVEMTVPGARAVIVKSITDLERLRLSVGSGPLFAVMSREKAYGYAAEYLACARPATLSIEALRAARGTGRRKIRAGKVCGCSPFVVDGPTANSA